MSLLAPPIIKPSAMAILTHVITGSANAYGKCQCRDYMVDAIQQGGPGCANSETEAARGVEEPLFCSAVFSPSATAEEVNEEAHARENQQHGRL